MTYKSVVDRISAGNSRARFSPVEPAEYQNCVGCRLHKHPKSRTDMLEAPPRSERSASVKALSSNSDDHTEAASRNRFAIECSRRHALARPKPTALHHSFNLSDFTCGAIFIPWDAQGEPREVVKASACVEPRQAGVRTDEPSTTMTSSRNCKQQTRVNEKCSLIQFVADRCWFPCIHRYHEGKPLEVEVESSISRALDGDVPQRRRVANIFTTFRSTESQPQH